MLTTNALSDHCERVKVAHQVMLLTHDGPNHSPKRVGLNSCCTASSKGIRRRSGTLYTSSEINSSSVEQVRQ